MIDCGACMPKPKTKPLQFKRGTSSAFRRVNPILLNGEPAFEWDTKRLKVGDGETRYNNLRYVNDYDKPEDGKSAYQLWIDCGNSGSVDDFLESLIGEPGKSTYEIWLSLGNEGTLEDFLDDIHGKPGVDGDSAYVCWIKAGNQGSIEDFFNDITGKSAYEIWLGLGNEGSEQDFINSLKGSKGDNGKSAFDIWKDEIAEPNASVDDYFTYLKGKSAYQIWLDAGNTGSEDNFLSSLKGTDGVDGVDGKSSFDIWKEVEGKPDATEEEFIGSLKTASWTDF